MTKLKMKGFKRLPISNFRKSPDFSQNLLTGPAEKSWFTTSSPLTHTPPQPFDNKRTER